MADRIDIITSIRCDGPNQKWGRFLLRLGAPGMAVPEKMGAMFDHQIKGATPPASGISDGHKSLRYVLIRSLRWGLDLNTVSKPT